MRISRMVALGAGLLVCSGAAAQDTQTNPAGQPRDAIGQRQGDRTLAEKRQHQERKGAMSQEQRDQLHPLAGRWRVRFEMHGDGQVDVGGGRAAFEGFSERRWVLGDAFLQETFSSGDAMTGAGQAGRGTALDGGLDQKDLPGVAFFGYDPEKGKFKVAWLDARSGSINVAPGEYDTATRTFTFHPKSGDKAHALGGDRQAGEGDRPGAMAAAHHEGKTVTLRLVSDDEHVVEMHASTKADPQRPDAGRPGENRGALARRDDAGLLYRVTYTRADRTSDRGATGDVREREIGEGGMDKDNKEDKGDK